MNKYEKIYEVNTYDMDYNRNLKMTALLNYLQDISTIHYQSIIQSMNHNDPLLTEGVWVIVEWDVKLSKSLEHLQKIRITTVPTYFRKFIAYRAYEIFNEQNEQIGEGISKWAFINQSTRRQENIPLVLYDAFKVPISMQKPPKMDQMSFEIEDLSPKKMTSLYSDIDVNRHVNNVSYVKWALDAHGFEKLFDRKVMGAKVVYKKEVFMNQEVSIHSKMSETLMETQHVIVDSKTNQECVKISFEWSM